MRLLFVLSELPYPAANGVTLKVRPILDYMARRHDCDVLAIGSQDDLSCCEPWLRRLPRLRIRGVFAADHVPFLRVRQVSLLMCGLGIPSSIRYRSRRLEEALELALAKRYYDVVHVDLISMAPYCTRLGARKRVLSLNDPLSLTLFDQAQNRFAPLRTRLGALVHALLQVRVDKKLFQMADAVHLVSGHDAEWCRDHLRALSAVQIPVAVRPESLQVVPSADERRGHTLVIVEKLWIHGHLSAVKQFLAAHWLTLRRRHPTARLILIGGRHIPSSFRSFIHGLPGAELYEWVHSLEDLLAGTSIAVFPYSGACGMKNRVLQCMAARNAVVGTSASFSGLPVRNGVEAVIADSHAEIAAGIDRLLNNPDARQEIGNCARRFIEAGYTEERVGRAWEQLYQDVAFAAPIQDSYPVEDKGFGP